MAHVQIFLSAVSAEFRTYRDRLRRDLTRPNVSVAVQEDFIVTGTETLDMLDNYIRQCDAVIHLVGDMTGALAKVPSQAVIQQRYPDLGNKLPSLVPFLQPGAPRLSYTQWEAWLALYHGKPLFIAAAEENAPRDEDYEQIPEQCAAQRAHVNRLAELERYPFRFVNADRLVVEVLRSKLQEILAGADSPTRQDSLSDPDLLTLLRTVKRDWIEGVRANSLREIVQLELGKESYVRAIDHPLQGVIDVEDQYARPLTSHIPIVDIFKRAGDFLLILGEPGAGKTITLLDLASELLTAAEREPSQPIPVVLNLSTWKESDSDLNSWIIGELKSKYFVQDRLSKKWLKDSQLLLMLDGLDEVKPTARAHCVHAINAFLEECSPRGMAVSCRFAEYETLPIRLRFRGAIKLLPLTTDQIDHYLTATGLEAIRTAVQRDAQLREMAQTPLVLNIMVLAYKDEKNGVVPIKIDGTTDQLYKSLMDRYIAKMFRRKGTVSKQPYTQETVLHSLSWLAQHLMDRSQTIFLMEDLQPDWLTGGAAWATYWVGTRVMWAVIFGLTFIGTDLLARHVLDIPQELVSIRYPGFLFALTCWAVVGGLIDGSLYGRRHTAQQSSKQKRFWLRLLVYGVPFALIILLCYTLEILQAPQNVTSMFWAAVALTLLAATVSGRSIKRDTHGDIVTKAFSWSWKRAEQGYIWGIVGFVIVICGMLPSYVPADFRRGGIVASCTGLIMLAAPYLRRHTRQEGGGQVLFLQKIGMTNYLVATGRLVIIALGMSFTFLVGNGVLNGTMPLWTDEALTVFGVGILVPLYFALMVASFTGIKPSSIESTTAPNQGILLTLRTAVATTTLVFLTGVLFYYGPALFISSFSTSSTREVIQSLFGFGVFALSVGLWYSAAVLRHFVLRLILYCQRSIPKDLPHFLDYSTNLIFLQKVGGGYVFIHRLVMEHFASLKETPSEGAPEIRTMC